MGLNFQAGGSCKIFSGDPRRSPGDPRRSPAILAGDPPAILAGDPLYCPQAGEKFLCLIRQGSNQRRPWANSWPCRGISRRAILRRAIPGGDPGGDPRRAIPAGDPGAPGRALAGDPRRRSWRAIPGARTPWRRSWRALAAIPGARSWRAVLFVCLCRQTNKRAIPPAAIPGGRSWRAILARDPGARSWRAARDPGGRSPAGDPGGRSCFTES